MLPTKPGNNVPDLLEKRTDEEMGLALIDLRGRKGPAARSKRNCAPRVLGR
jgi:hypothetical protein